MNSPITIAQWGAYAVGLMAIIGLIKVVLGISHQVQLTREHAEQVPGIKEDLGKVRGNVEDLTREAAEVSRKLSFLQKDVNTLDGEFSKHQLLVAVTTAEMRESVKTAETTAIGIKAELHVVSERLTKMVEEMGGLKEAVRRNK